MGRGLSDAERYRFEADGFLVVPEALSRGDVAHVRSELAAAAEGAAGYGYEHQTSDLLLAGGSLRAVTNPLAAAPVVLDVALHPGFFPKLNDALGGSARLLSNEYFVTPAGSKPRLGWHRDATETNFPTIALGSSLVLLNCLVLLSDVAADNGPTLGVPGSHRWGPERTLDGFVGHPDPGALPGHVELCGPAGTAVFFNARLFHAQSENRSTKERHALVFVYGHRWMRAFPGFEPTVEQAEALGGNPIRDQLLGLGPAFDEPVAEYEAPARFAAST
jgi:ectoine hydroxylase-related dioxygenase (phytanoyl-CoA dioxygenase family)